MRRRRPQLVAVLSAAALLALGCGDRDVVVVGSKNFVEQDILGELLAQELEGRGVPVNRKLHLGGTFLCHRALVEGGIDLYVEYTGTALTAILGREPMQDPQEVYQLVQSEYARKFDLVLGAPLGFDNTFAMAIRRSTADTLGLRVLSDAIPYAGRWTAGFGYEFMSRLDGYPGLRSIYGLEFKDIRQMDLGLMYRALADGRVDIVAGNATDGQIIALNLVILEDDRRAFPPYQAAPVVRQEALDRYPELGEVLSSLAGAISEEEMRRLNAEVTLRGRDVSEVVREWRRDTSLSLHPPR